VSAWRAASSDDFGGCDGQPGVLIPFSLADPVRDAVLGVRIEARRSRRTLGNLPAMECFAARRTRC